MSNIEKGQLNELLRLNGMGANADEEQIRSVLISAHWNDTDIETAILVLKQNLTNKESHVDSFQHVFHTEDKLSPEMVSRLLGIEMQVTPNSVKGSNQTIKKIMNLGQIFRLVGMSITLSVSILIFAMWYFEIGIFFAA